MRNVLYALVFSMAVAPLAAAQEKKDTEELPAPRAEQEGLPAPRVVEPDAIVPLMLLPRPDYPRPGRRSIWQLYAVDSMGHFQPRVVASPYGAYYQHNGAPYPVPQTRPGEWSRFISQ
jgi:hypothetical protein